ncbi:RBFA factor, partial [Amia calva]|nr:RBFA factor [Amia calva]
MRIQILNSLLFKAISDLLHSSDVSSEICLLNVEISKVSLPLDFSCCRVYWKTSGTSEKDDLIQQGLNKCAPRIRYLLIADQILGSVPPVTFIKDKEYAAVSEIERLLKIADFGPGENTEELEQSLKDRGDSVRVAAASEQPTTSTAPGLFGIDHEALNRQILEYKRRTKEALVESSQFSLTEQQQELLAELRKQKIINKKKKKKSKRDIDIDITPQAYLLEKYSQEHSTEELEGPEYSTEDSEIKELISEEDQKNRFV